MDEWPDVRQVLTLPQPPVESLAGAGQDAARWRESANDGLAELVQKYPDHFIAFGACVPMNNPGRDAEGNGPRDQPARREGDSALHQHQRHGRSTTPEFQPVFDEMARRDLPIWLHPTRGADFPDYATEEKSLYEIWWTFGWPYETSAAMSRLVFSGLFDRHPNIKIITHHGGAMIPFFEGRVGYGWDQLGKRTSDVDYSALLKSMKKRPVDYFRSLLRGHGDVRRAGGHPVQPGLLRRGQVLFASDMPFEPTPGLYLRETIRVIESLGLTPDQKEKIYRTNAEKMLKL